MTRTGIGCGLGKTLQQEPNVRGINGRKLCAMTPNPCGPLSSTLGVTRIVRRGAQCRVSEEPLAPADNCLFKSKANHEELAFATASPASKGPAVFLQALASFSAPFKVFGTATEYVRVGDQGAKFIFRFCPVC